MARAGEELVNPVTGLQTVFRNAALLVCATLAARRRG
jgi:hypothetical protein